MATRAITALYDDYDSAAKAVDKVEAAGVPHAEISIVASNEGDRHSSRIATTPDAGPGTSPSRTGAAERDAAEGAGAGATVGTVLGGGAGLLAGLGLLAIPGIGPVVAAGWLVATVAGAGVGAATGGMLGALTGAGLSDADAETYAEGLRRGGTLVTVRADDAMAERVMEILERGGSIDLDERAQGWRAQGWTGGTASPDSTLSPPVSAAHEIGSTAIGAAASTTTGLDTESGTTLLPTGDPKTPADPELSPPSRPIAGGIR